ncbi:MAG: ribosomal-protein-alanine N-acetyltransferase [Candidatus Actinomarinales bacterium]|nr:MAG: ribosomal-protein-alanine N-acetyltransferase [Candidatus Actinomarinales bacterium]
MVSIVSNCDLNQAKNLSELEKKIFNTSWDPSWIREKINNQNAIYWIKKENDEIIGYLAIQFTGVDIEILGLGVLPNYRRKGYASDMMVTMMDYLKQYNYNKIFLEVRDSNNVAKALYSKFNFNRSGTRLNYYKDENAALYETSINND